MTNLELQIMASLRSAAADERKAGSEYLDLMTAARNAAKHKSRGDARNALAYLSELAYSICLDEQEHGRKLRELLEYLEGTLK